MAEDVTVLGAGFAGMRAALELSRRGYDVKLVDLREEHEYTPGIIEVLDRRVGENRLEIDTEEFLEGTGVEFVHAAVEGILPGERKVKTGDDEHVYENLVVALGGEPRTFGVDLSEAYSMYSLESAEAVEQELEGAETAAVVGSGYVGMETACELERRGLEVRVLEQATRPMPNSPEKASHLALEYVEDRDINFMGGRKVVEIDEDGVETESGDEVEADVVVWAAGVETPEMVQESFDCGAAGVDVNSGLASEEYTDVFAAGDSADTGELKTAHNAVKQAELLAGNVGKDEGEALDQYEPGKTPLLVSLGTKAIFIYGDFVVKNRLLRYFKHLVRWKYFARLKLAQIRARLQ